MLHRLLLTILIFYCSLYFFKESSFVVSAMYSNDVLGATDVNLSATEERFAFPSVDFSPQIKTTTAFDQKETEEYETIPYDIEYIDDLELAYGEERIEKPGVSGLVTRKYLVTFWFDDIIDKQLLDTNIENPSTEVVAVGKKIYWDDLNTPDLGKIDYWRKMTVFATKYDSTCIGCNNTTALGAPVQEGVCAVDPSVIGMYTHFYVPGYGKCQALDVGGLIKGNRIDLAFRDAHSVDWGAEYVEIYLMDNVPEDAVE